MNPFVQIAQGVVGAILISLFFILRSSFGETRHTLSIIGAIILFIASGYILRTRLIRWGSRQVWLKAHQRLASLGLSLVLIHSAAQPLAWHSWMAFILALLNLGTGVAVSLTAHRARRILLRCHLALAPILLLTIVLHGREKLDHDEFFPLTEVHDVPCVKCHTSEMLLFTIDPHFQSDLDSGGVVSEDLQWEFNLHGTSLSRQTTISTEKGDNHWLVTDEKNEGEYTVKTVGDRLSVHADAVYEAYTCLTCHVHNTPEIQFDHESHGVKSYNACLNCHQTVINGTKYGTRKANWEYNP